MTLEVPVQMRQPLCGGVGSGLCVEWESWAEDIVHDKKHSSPQVQEIQKKEEDVGMLQSLLGAHL